MIIQVAGTSGSGKSHLFRAFLDYARQDGIVSEQENGYLIKLGKQLIFVLGKYNVPTGGCDTIHDIPSIYSEIVHLAEIGTNVLYEGLFVMNQTRGPQLAERFGRNVVVLQLTTPLATCFASINARRAERGKDELATRKNTEDNYRRATNYCAKMRDSGARVFKVSRDEALPKLLELLE